MTKSELLNKMREHGACGPAVYYVKNHPSNDAADIGGGCERFDWLIWLLAREERLARFVTVAARRARKFAKVSAAASLRAAEEYRLAVFDNTREAAALDAAYFARCAAAPLEAAGERVREELEAQRAGLQRIFRDWANGLPAEKALPV